MPDVLGKKQFSQNTDKLLIFWLSLSFLEGIMGLFHGIMTKYVFTKKTFKTPENRHHLKENNQNHQLRLFTLRFSQPR